MTSAFHERLERKAIELSFHADRDYIRGTLRTLKENKDEAFDLLRLALNEPRFEPAAVERMRAQLISRIAAPDRQPERHRQPQLVEHRVPRPSLWPSHQRHARDAGATSPPTTSDLRAARASPATPSRSRVVGDIDAATAGKLIDQTFGTLPAKANLRRSPTSRRRASAAAS